MKKKYFLLLFLFSPINGMEQTSSSDLLNLPREALSCIVRNCDDLYTANNVLRSCKTIQHLYKTYSGTVTEESVEQIFFGIDRVIADKPQICKSLSKTAHLRGLVHYAQQYNHDKKNKKMDIWRILCNEATDEQAKTIKSMRNVFNVAGDYAFLAACVGKKTIFFNMSNAESLSIAINIHLQNRITSVMSLENLFFIAVENNITPAVKTIITKNTYTSPTGILLFSINKENHKNQTALHIAADKGYLKLTELLLEHKDINPNSSNKHNATPLTEAVWHNQTATVTLLLKHPKFDLLYLEQGFQALNGASRMGNLEIVKLLLQHPQIDIHQGVQKAFMAAMRSDEATPVVQYLLEHPHLDLASYGAEALYGAISTAHYEVSCENNIMALCKYPSIDQLDINFIHPEEKKTCLFLALIYAQRAKNKVIEYKDPNYQIAYRNLKNIIELLLKLANIDVNIVYNSKTWRCSIREGYSCPTTDYYDYQTDWTALYYAVIKKNTELAQLLVNHPNIDPNIICNTHEQETALHAAVRGKHIEIIKLLLGHPKTDPSICNKDGVAAYSRPINIWHPSIEESVAQSCGEAKDKKEYIFEISPRTSYTILATSTVLAGIFCFWAHYKIR